MNRNNIVDRRRSKEAAVVGPSDLKIPFHLYQVAIEHALARLTPLERSVIVLRFKEDRPIARIADLLGMSWNGANTLIDGAVEKFRRLISGTEFEFKQSTNGDLYETA